MPVLDELNKTLGTRNKNIDSRASTELSESAFGAAAVAEPAYVDADARNAVNGSPVSRGQGVVRDTNKPRNPDTALNEDQHELLADVKAIFDEVELSGGVQPATALNMHPWPINATGPHNTGIVLPMCPIPDEFVPFTFRGFRRDFADRGGKFKVTPVWPITILRDFQRQHELWGGIVVYLGDRVPGQTKTGVESLYDKLWKVLKKITDKEVKEMLQETIEEGRRDILERTKRELTDEEIKRLIIQANDRRILYYESMYQTAEQIAADPKENHRKITHHHRQIARWMVHRKRYSVLPRWVSETKPRDFVETNCFKCGASVDMDDKTKRPKGFACAKCGYVHDGVRAYIASEIDEEHPSLTPRRLQALGYTVEELKALGVPELAEFLTEKKERKGKAESKDKEPKQQGDSTSQS